MDKKWGNQSFDFKTKPFVIGTAAVVGKKEGEGLIGHEKTPDRLNSVRITCGTVGKVIDAGVTDANQMGAAMAPAAVDTIINHLKDTGRDIDYYDGIYTGDLGYIGRDIAKDLLVDAGLNKKELDARYEDCGAMIFFREQQDVHGGGSGCGCSASIFSSYIYKNLQNGKLSRVLLLSTGAMLSTISPLQGESIPGIAHAVVLEREV